MHSNDIYLRVLDWFDTTFPLAPQSLLAPQSILSPQEGQFTPRGEEHQQKQTALQMSYSERREQWKNSQSRQKPDTPTNPLPDITENEQNITENELPQDEEITTSERV